MELPRRQRGDELLQPGEITRLRMRLRNLAGHHDLATVIACAFDHRTRILPFIYADMKMVPAGVRAIGSAMLDCGFQKTRIVLQQWNRNFRPSQARLDGRIPDLFMVSSMHLHSAECNNLIRDVCRIEPAKRPLVITGGPKVIYDPWDVFRSDPNDPWGADVAVTGEEFVLLQLLDVLLSMRAAGESMRQVFFRARDQGALDGIPGLVYSNTSDDCVAEELVDTGIQRLLGDLDELPHPVHGYRIVESPSRDVNLARLPIPAEKIRKYSPVSSLVLTFGCKFRCSYCPIPAYNQRQHRVKSGARVADEIQQIGQQFGIVNFFGADDNFFNDTERTLDICETLARKAAAGKRPFCKIRWATEATVHDSVRLKEHLPVIRRSGLTAVWLGVEDITASLVRKGQSEDKTLQAFQLLRENGIFPIPMLMHHDDQPLYSRGKNYGLINQLSLLRRAGALYMQVLMLTPARGSKFFEETFSSGLAFKNVDGVAVEPHISDGNYVVASNAPRPWVKQLNLLAGYTYFFNPLRLLWALLRPKSRIPLVDAETTPPAEWARYSRPKKLRRWVARKLKAHCADAGVQFFGMVGLFHTYRRTFPWTLRLLTGRIERCSEVPASHVPMRAAEGGPASHAIPGTTCATPRKVDVELQSLVASSRRRAS